MIGNRINNVCSLVLDKIVTLNLNNVGVSDLDLVKMFSLSRYPNLREIDLSNNNLTEIKFISNLINLEKLVYTNNHLEDFKLLINSVRKLAKIQVLDLRNNYLCLGFYESKNWNVSERIWHSIDTDFIPNMKDCLFVKRLCYRSSIINSCKKTIRVLDGLVISQAEINDSLKYVERLKKAVKKSKDTNSCKPKNIEQLKNIEIEKMTKYHDKENLASDFDKNEQDIFGDWNPTSYPLEKTSRKSLYVEIDHT